MSPSLVTVGVKDRRNYKRAEYRSAAWVSYKALSISCVGGGDRTTNSVLGVPSLLGLTLVLPLTQAFAEIIHASLLA